jgi:arginyl-tRNA synthetase
MQIKETIKTLLEEALKSIGVQEPMPIEIEVPNDQANGDFSTNLAMKLARTLKKPPFVIADMLLEAMKDSTLFERTEVAKPGFINFYLDKRIYLSLIPLINKMGASYGNSNLGKDEWINIEFVSANPTGSLHIGHARGAAAGDSLARVLTKAGYKVTKEFYVNDGGNQIHNLALSIDARYKALFNQDAKMPEDGYYGKEIIALAESIKQEEGDRFIHEDGYQYFKAYGVNYLLEQLKKDLEAFHVSFDVWFSEASLYETKQIEETLAFLKANGHTYLSDDALWLKSSLHGDEKDRVIVKSDGSYTYLLPDIAYHKNKLSRGYTKLIDILGGDHHGYVPRLKAAIEMVGGNKDLLDVDLLQMVKVMQNGEEVKMSKRSGKAITLIDLIEEVGADPIRYFFAARSLNTHMELDLDLALKETNENPVFYAQYAHARIASILRSAEERAIKTDFTIETFNHLTNPKALELLNVLSTYQEVVEESALKRIPHKVTQFIQRLATALHSYYAEEIVLTSDLEASNERLALLSAVKIVLSDALSLVGVHAKERM